MVGGGEEVIFLEKPGRSKESKGRKRRWGQGCLEGCGLARSTRERIQAHKELGTGLFGGAGGGCQSVWLGCCRGRRATDCSRGGRYWLFQSARLGFCRGSRALVRLWNGRNVGNSNFTLAINRRGSESDGVCDIWELLTRISCFLVEK